VATFALIHGGGGSAWDWHLVVPALEERGHDAVAVDLPSGTEAAGWRAYAGAVVEAVAGRRDGIDDVFYHDVPPQLAAEAKRRERDEAARALREPWPLDAWPETPTRYLLCRDDHMFRPAWARRHARERLGIEADEMDGGHYVSLSRPRELAERLDAYALRLR